MTSATGFAAAVFYGFSAAAAVNAFKHSRLAKQKATDMRRLVDLHGAPGQPEADEPSGFLNTFAEPLKNTAWGAKLANDYATSGQKSTFSKYILSMLLFAIIGYCLGSLVMGNPVVAWALVPAGFITPIMITRSKLGNMQEALRKQMPEVLALIVSSLRAGNSLSQAFIDAAEQLDYPAGAQFALAVKNEALGLSTEQALKEVAESLLNEEFQLMTQAILALKQSGGNLAEILDNISALIRDRSKLMSEVKNATTQQRMSAKIVGVIPVLIAVSMYAQDSKYYAKMLASSTGIWLLVMAASMNASGYFLTMRLSKVKV